jgi:transcriptional regulator with XRE-family HTH domain
MLNSNPYAFLRRKCGLTQRRFCELYKFAKQTLVGIETGMYPSLSDRMVAAIEQACFDYDIDMLAELDYLYGTVNVSTAYEQWIVSERSAVPDNVRSYRPVIWDDKRSPMYFFVFNTVGSAQGFAKLLKVPAATLVRYMDGKQENMPGAITAALKNVQYEFLTDLMTYQTNWVKEYR